MPIPLAEEVFGLDDAKTLKAFADQTPWVCSLHYWSINDDVPKIRHHKVIASATNETGVVTYSTNSVSATNTRSSWSFAKIFQPFTTP